MTINQNLDRISQAKSDIKAAIIAKGGTIGEDVTIDKYAAAIEALPSGGDDTLNKIFDQTVEEIHNTTPIEHGYYLFYKQPNLRVADVVLKDILKTASQYYNMFRDCKSLQTVPDLPATTLTDCCYRNMFDGCSALTQAPALPATELTMSCYEYMFGRCTSLVQAPELPATTLAQSCYYNMFSNCSALTQAPELPATTLERECYGNMFYNCASLVQAPDLPATTLAMSCYSYMFQRCTSLQKTGVIAATGNISSAASNMFNGCTSLKEMTWTATTPPTINTYIWTNCPADMIIYVPDASVNAYKAASVWSSRAAYIKPISEKPTE